MASISSRRFLLAMAGGTCAMALTAVVLQILKRMDNIPYYAALCLTFVVGALATLGISCLLPVDRLPQSRFYTAKHPLLMVGAALLIGIWLSFADDLPLNTWSVATYDQPWRFDMVKRALCAVAAVGLAGGSCLLFRRLDGHSCSRWMHRWLWMYHLLFALLSVYLLYTPNPDRWLDYFHRYTYSIEIYNVWRGIPYDLTTAGVYGHFGMLFAPVLWLMGGCTPHHLFMIYALIGGVVSLLFSKIISNLTHNPVLHLLAPPALMLLYMFLLPTIYYQGYPNRLLLVMMLGCFLSSKHKGRAWRLGLHASVIFALMWMTDMGMVYILSVAAYECLEGLMENQGKKFWKKSVQSIGWVAAEVGTVYLMVNVYNLLCGGEWIVREFIWPLSYGTNVPESHWLVNYARSGRTQMAFLYSYFWMIALFLGCVAHAVRCGLRRSDAAADALLLGGVAVYGLGAMVYYIVRPAYPNQFQVYPALLLCLFILASGRTRIRNAGEPEHAGHQFLAVALAAFFVTGTAFTLPVTMSRVRILQTNPSHVDVVAAQIEEKVPENTWATGIPVEEVYAILGWESHTVGDVSHAFMNAALRERLFAELQDQTSFVDFDNLMLNLNDEAGAYIRQHFTAAAQGGSGPLCWVYYTRP